MATVRLRYVKAYKDRHGRQRHYYRQPGMPSVALPGEPGSVEFAEAYERAKNQAKRAIGADKIMPGTFAAVITDYYQTSAYKDLAPITKRTYRNVLERFREGFGGLMVRDLTPKRLDGLLDDLAEKRGAQDTFRKVLRLVLKLAVRQGLIATSPMEGVRLSRKPIKGFHAWSDAEIAQYEAKWPSGSRERLALALLLYTLQRRGDVVGMGKQHVRPGKIHVVQSKTGARLWLPIVPALQAELDRVPADQLTFLQTQYGKPFTAAGFTKWFRVGVKDAGLPDECAPHGLRKAGARRLAENGCTPSQIMAVTGHANLAEVTHYTASADQERLAEQAMRKTGA